MAGKGRGSTQEIVRQRLNEVRAAQARGESSREIARHLGIAESSYRHALKTITGDEALSDDRANGDPRGLPPARRVAVQAYEGVPVQVAETIRTLVPAMQEVSELLPALREVSAMLPTLKSIASRGSEPPPLEDMPEAYRNFLATYSVRVSPALIDAIKAYAKRHRLTQSEVITTAVHALLNRG
jgi:hypothetical protein